MPKKEIGTVIEHTFLKLLKDIFKDNLLSAMIYGSYVSGNYIKDASDINILIILKNPDAKQIINLGIKANKIIKKYKITPLIFSRNEFVASADVFPIEYFDIKEEKKVIFGEDETKSLSLTRKNLRHQLEDRLRGNVSNLRQLLLASSGKDKIIGNYLKTWIGSFNAIFRGLLRLKNISLETLNKKDILPKIEENFKINTNPFSNLIKFRNGEKINPKDLAFDVLLKLEELIKIVDKMEYTD